MPNPMTDRQASVALFFAASFWGLYWLPVRMIEAAGLSPSFSVALFNVAPLLVLVPLVVLRRRTELRHWPQVVFIGGTLGIGLGLYAMAMVVAPVIRVTMLFYLTPVWSTLIGVFWLNEPLTLRRIIAVLLGFAGLSLLLAGGGLSDPLGYGDFCALAAGVFWGFGAAGLKRWPDAPTVMVTTVQFLSVVLFCTFVAGAVLAEPLPNLSAVRSALPVAVLASLLVLMPSAYVMFVTARLLYPGRVGILMMSEVLVAILSASILLPDETMTLVQWIGGVVVLTACVIEIASQDQGTLT